MIQLSTKETKRTGSHYTPTILSDFVASNIVSQISGKKYKFKILDPAVGDGELLLSIIKEFYANNIRDFEIFGFDTNKDAIDFATSRIKSLYPEIKLNLECKDFLEFVLDNYSSENSLDLFKSRNIKFDIIITNPPYVRTQVLGAETSQKIALQFNLKGRVDLYHAFLKAYSMVLRNGGTAGIIVSNRFMVTRAGSTTRKTILQLFDLLNIWDFGDTKLFEAAVLPAVLLVRRNINKTTFEKSSFVSIYSSDNKKPEYKTETVIDALKYKGLVRIKDGRVLNVKQGVLDHGLKMDSVWRLSSEKVDNWLNQIKNNTFTTFGEIGKVRVGVKTTADKIFIREDWSALPTEMQPEYELLKPLFTHHVAQRFKVQKQKIKNQILYPHIISNGKRSVVNLQDYPKTLNYLNSYREKLESRKYVIDSGRNWFELWVPQDPSSWKKHKIVFWDISKKPTFWLDMSGAIVNGDCYWFTLNDEADENYLWLILAISNSTFIEEFYDHKFNNKLYAGRRRFMTQYVESFPIPVINTYTSKKIIKLTQELYYNSDDNYSPEIYNSINTLVWHSFGLNIEKITR
jgi:tRNA1(Val) A37 N6-methylase TrmN6